MNSGVWRVSEHSEKWTPWSQCEEPMQGANTMKPMRGANERSKFDGAHRDALLDAPLKAPVRIGSAPNISRHLFVRGAFKSSALYKGLYRRHRIGGIVSDAFHRRLLRSLSLSLSIRSISVAKSFFWRPLNACTHLHPCSDFPMTSTLGKV